MLNLLEMAGTCRAKHIAEPLMVYNCNPSIYDALVLEECARNLKTFENRPPKSPLPTKPIH